MSVIKCKSCGKTIEYKEGDTAVVCPDCGATQELPVLDEEEIIRRDKIYSGAEILIRTTADKKLGYTLAIREFKSIPGWRDADERVIECEKAIEELEAKEKADILEKKRREEERRNNIEKEKKESKKILAIVFGVIAFILLLKPVIIPNIRYYWAVALYNKGEYEEAIDAFNKINGFRNSSIMISNCIEGIMTDKYESAIALFNEGKVEEAYEILISLDGYKDSAEKASEIKYDAAVAALNEGKVVEAYESFIVIEGYKDSAEKASEIFNRYKTEKIKVAEAGDVVFWGAYEQDNDKTNGKENIEWIVLAKENNKLLVISDKILDAKAYNTSYTDVTWETCSLRAWLNSTFSDDAFSAEEQSQILSTEVSADPNPRYSTDPGNPVTDKLFLLSITEAEKYLSSDEDRRCSATEYAVADGLKSCWWWLRTSGNHPYNAAIVLLGGTFSYIGTPVEGANSCEPVGVRPAMWISSE